MINHRMLREVYVSLMLFVSGCQSEKPIEIAYNCPKIQLPPDPKPATKMLNSGSLPDIVVKSWVSDMVAYRGWDRIVRQQVSAMDTQTSILPLVDR